jgi:phospholipase C
MSKCTRWVDKGVIECKSWVSQAVAACETWADEGSNQCKTWADQGSNQCQQWSDQGHNECSSWADEGHNECCDWWPCSWACDAFYWVANWVCHAWYWVANWVCQAWYWVAKWVCVAWYWVAKWVCKIFGWLVIVVCLVWSWVARLVCVAWDKIGCLIRDILGFLLGRGSRRREGIPAIKHVFVLMMENRAFDHMLGFSGIRGTDAVTGLPTTVDGLVGNPQFNIDPANPGVQVFASTPADFKVPTADKDPGHEFADTLEQLCGQGAVYPDPITNQYPITPANHNTGFIASYRDIGSPSPTKIMNCYTPRQVPVLNALAAEFAVCDRWFSSMPGPTWPNRFFIHAASSGGLDDSPSGLQVALSTLVNGYRFENGTIFDRLDENCLDWEIFEGDEFPQSFAINGMSLNALEGRFTDFEFFSDRLQDSSYSPVYIFIEPNYGNILPGTSEDYTCGTSQHPLDDVTRGERLIKEVYEALRNSPHWENSVLVITYDEHGGFYDHVQPPPTVAPGDVISDPANNHNNFDFTQLGVRVPAVVVSPLIPRGLIDHTDYDHTSLLATLEKIFGLQPLTARDANANDFLHLFSLSTPRTDAPTTLPEPANSGFRCEDDPEEEAESSSALQGRLTADGRPIPSSLWGFLHTALLKHLSMTSYNKRNELINNFREIRSEAQARQYIQQVRQEIRANKSTLSRRQVQRLRQVDQ